MIFCGAAFAVLALLAAGAYLPKIVFMLYVLASAAAFLAYGLDKSAAKRGGRRISEKSLHAISLMGGWPGACLGRQMFRHKTQKTSFLVVFWLAAALNCALVGWWFLWPAGLH